MTKYYRSEGTLLIRNSDIKSNRFEFSGELIYLDPKEYSSREPALIGGIGLSYNTSFKLYVQAEYLYNESAEQSTINNFNDFYYRDLSVRDLSMAPHTFFVNLSYPATPLLNLGVSTMYFPSLNGVFMGPSCDLSLRNDLDLSLFLQYF